MVLSLRDVVTNTYTSHGRSWRNKGFRAERLRRVTIRDVFFLGGDGEPGEPDGVRDQAVLLQAAPRENDALGGQCVAKASQSPLWSFRRRLVRGLHLQSVGALSFASKKGKVAVLASFFCCAVLAPTSVSKVELFFQNTIVRILLPTSLARQTHNKKCAYRRTWVVNVFTSPASPCPTSLEFLLGF